MKPTPHISDNMEPLPPVLDNGDVPFEPPQRFARTRKIIRHVSRKRKKPPSDLAISALAIAYFGGALAVGFFNQGFLLSAWLTTGPLFVTIYMTFEGKGSLLNPYTMFFATILVVCVAAYFFTG